MTLLLFRLFNVWFNPHSFHLDVRNGHLYGSLIDILSRATPLMLISLGMTLVVAVGNINISAGAVVAISGAITASLVDGTLMVQSGLSVYVTKVPLLLALLAAVGAALVRGIWNGLLVVGTGMQPTTVTLILMVVGHGVAQPITGRQIITVYYEPFFFMGDDYLFGLLFRLYIAAAVLGLLLLLMYHTAPGPFVGVVGINPMAVRLAGLNTKALLFGIYASCGTMASAVGFIICSNIKSANGDSVGLLLELSATLAATPNDASLAGGKFSLWDGVVGALVIQTLTCTIYSMGVPPKINLVVKAVVAFIVCLARLEVFRSMLFQRHSCTGTQL